MSDRYLVVIGVLALLVLVLDKVFSLYEKEKARRKDAEKKLRQEYENEKAKKTMDTGSAASDFDASIDVLRKLKK